MLLLVESKERLGLFGRNADDFEPLARILVIDFFKHGERLAARSAPSGPEIEKSRLRSFLSLFAILVEVLAKFSHLASDCRTREA